MVDAVDINGFRGLVPSGEKAGLPANYASIAENVDLRRGCVEPWRTPRKTTNFGEPICRVHLAHGCCWIGNSDSCAKYVTANLNNATFVSGVGRPRYSKDPCKELDWCPVGLPKPDSPLAMGGTILSEEFTHARDYIITYCRDCDEGPPSVPSNVIKANKDDPVMLELPDAPAEWCVTHINIYRLMPIQDVNTDAYLHPELSTSQQAQAVLLNQEVDADYFRVAQVPVGTQQFMDVGTMLCQDRKLLSTMHDHPPPKCLCIVGETRHGSMVGFVPGERLIYFSRRNCPGAWPGKDQIKIEDDLIHVCVCGNTVYAFTCNKLYVLDDAFDAKADGCRRPILSKCPLPLCSCESPVKHNGGVIFASRNGWVSATADGNFTVLSGPYFSQRDWDLIEPCSIRAAKHNGALHFTSNTGSWIMELDLNNTGTESLNLTTSSIRPCQYIEGPSGELYMLLDGQVYEWDAGNDFLEYTWKEAAQNECAMNTVTDARIIFDDLPRHKCQGAKTHFTLYNDNGVLFSRTVEHSREFKIRSNRSEETSISVCGTAAIKRIKYGAGRKCLRAFGRGG